MSQRPVVIACAVIGAAFVIAGSLIGTPQSRQGSQQSTPQTQQPGRSIGAPHDSGERANIWLKRLTLAGYAITFVSIALFIVAGFVSDLRP